MTDRLSERPTLTADAPPGARISGCLLLAGGPTPSEIVAGTGRSVLDLSIDGKTTLAEHWLGRLAAIHPATADPLPVRIVYCDNTPTPSTPEIPGNLDVTVLCEQNRYRGAAGLVVDNFSGGEHDAFLILEAARWSNADIATIVSDHHARNNDITVGVNPDQSPAGIYVVGTAPFELVPDRGYMDLKEQWLSRAVEAGRTVRVSPVDAPGAHQIRTRDQLLNAACGPAPALFGTSVAQGGADVPVHHTASIAPDAIVARSMIMQHATVGAGAVVVRSVLGPGATVAPNEQVIDEIRAGAPAGGTR